MTAAANGQINGGGERDRTDDLLNANQMLSQLSYTPKSMVGLGRFELPTSRLSGVRSNQLSYRPKSLTMTERDTKTANYHCMTTVELFVCFEGSDLIRE